MGRSDSAAARDESSFGKKVPIPPKQKTIVVDAGRQELIQKEKQEGYLAKTREKHQVWTNVRKQFKAFHALRKRVNVAEDDWIWDESSNASQADLVAWKLVTSQRKAYEMERTAADSGGCGDSADSQEPESSVISSLDRSARYPLMPEADKSLRDQLSGVRRLCCKHR